MRFAKALCFFLCRTSVCFWKGAAIARLLGPKATRLGSKTFQGSSNRFIQPVQSGNVRLQFKLNGSAGHAITVLIFAEFDIVMEIDNDNGVLYNDDS